MLHAGKYYIIIYNSRVSAEVFFFFSHPWSVELSWNKLFADAKG